MSESQHAGALDQLHSFTFQCVVWICFALFNLIAAFPFKWCWNYGMTHAFGLPSIEWGHAFCLLWVLTYLRTVTVDRKTQ